MTREKFDKASELLKEIAELGNMGMAASELCTGKVCVSIQSNAIMGDSIDLPKDLTMLLILELQRFINGKRNTKHREFENL